MGRSRVPLPPTKITAFILFFSYALSTGPVLWLTRQRFGHLDIGRLCHRPCHADIVLDEERLRVERKDHPDSSAGIMHLGDIHSLLDTLGSNPYSKAVSFGVHFLGTHLDRKLDQVLISFLSCLEPQVRSINAYHSHSSYPSLPGHWTNKEPFSIQIALGTPLQTHFLLSAFRRLTTSRNTVSSGPVCAKLPLA